MGLMRELCIKRSVILPVGRYNKTMSQTNLRHAALQEWLAVVLAAPFTSQSMTPGAGTRRYFRISSADRTFVAMDSPADKKCIAFVHLAEKFHAAGVAAPKIYAMDLQQGFLLLTDFGDNLYGSVLNADNVDRLYQQALQTLLLIQSCPAAGEYSLQPFDMLHYREKMQWFVEFYLRRYVNFTFNQGQQPACERIFDVLITTALQQPKICVHYDYHCRNLIALPNGQTGVLDFQDAVLGPITYDLMSLLRDCYIDWPVTQVYHWMEQYRQMALRAGVLLEENPEIWRRWCDFSSAQRHIKCIGLFARFHILGTSSGYLSYIPRSLNYLRQICTRYTELSALEQLLEKIA
jgi:N-acetylmuramate 1-kinase